MSDHSAERIWRSCAKITLSSSPATSKWWWSGPKNAKAFADYFAKESLPFIGLPDPTASVLKLYGQEVNLFKLGRMPAQVLIDKAGWRATSTTATA